MNKENVKKIYRFSPITVDKIEKLKAAKELENPGIKVYNQDIVVEAIDLLYSSKFGKEVFNETMKKLENMIKYTVHDIVKTNLEPFAVALDNLYREEQISKETMLMMLRANGIITEDQNIVTNQVFNNDTMNEMIEKAIHEKRDID